MDIRVIGITGLSNRLRKSRESAKKSRKTGKSATADICDSTSGKRCSQVWMHDTPCPVSLQKVRRDKALKRRPLHKTGGIPKMITVQKYLFTT